MKKRFSSILFSDHMLLGVALVSATFGMMLFFTLFPFNHAAAVDCWCRAPEGTCEHHSDSSGVTTCGTATTDASTPLSYCNNYCAGRGGGTWRAAFCDSTYIDRTEAGNGSCSSPSAGTSAGTSAASSTTESAAVQNARTQDCPPPTSLFPMTLNIPLGSVTQVNGLADYINEAYRFGVGVVLIVAIVMVVWGGFRYLIGSSMGDIARGKEIIRDAIVGMLLVLGAYTILQVVNPATTNLSPPAITNVGCVPLALTQAEQANLCASDTDCGEGKKCVNTGFVYDSQEAHIGHYLFSTGVAPIRGLVSFVTGGGFVDGYVRQFGRIIKYCSDGQEGSPCGEDIDCTESEISCIESWNLCARESGLPARSPCDSAHACSAGSDACVGGTQAICRGTSTILTNEDLRAAGFDLNRLPDDKKCAVDHDCTEPGAKCSGPAGHQVRVCVPGSAWVSGVIGETYRTEEEQVQLGSICFLGQHGVIPLTCSGAGGSAFTCMACPSSGERNWERLNASTDPARTRIGSCRHAADLGTRCGGGS